MKISQALNSIVPVMDGSWYDGETKRIGQRGKERENNEESFLESIFLYQRSTAREKEKGLWEEI